MASASLNKMTVPVAGDSANPAQGMLMPKLQYRFRVLFENIGSGVSTTPTTTELTKQVIDFTRPTVTFPEIPLEIYNSRIYLAGKAEWQTVTCTVRDDVNNNVTALVGNQIQKQMDFAEQASAAAGIDYKFKTTVQILDGGNGVNEPNVLESWELYGCFIQSANYQTLNYGSNEAVQIQMTIRFDNAQQAQLDSGVSGDFGRGIGASVGARLTGDNTTGTGSTNAT